MAPNLKIFTRLLQETGWEDELIKYTDYEYEDNHPETGNALGPSVGGGVSSYLCPEHRRFGYTAFVETDSVFEKEWGIKINVSEYGAIENWDEVKRIIEEKCAAVDIYSQTSNAAGSPQDWTDPDNVVNLPSYCYSCSIRFVSYPYERDGIFVYEYQQIVSQRYT